ncbi:MAG: mutual gliding-motility protein MglA, partial [Thermodesulfobacteriota bacterium]|nr:mutual gliding-motility protein MglA [Thermodesulfobacteriota bacterium]
LAEQGIPVLSFEEMEKDLNSVLKAPSFSASAITGVNVVQTMKKIIAMTIASIKQELK